MARLPTLLAVVVVSVSCLAADVGIRPTIRSAAQFHVLSSAEAARHAPFEMTGQVIFINNRHRLFVADSTGCLAVDTVNGQSDITTGDIVRVSGRTQVTASMEPVILGEKITRLGKAPLPEPVEANEIQMRRGELNFRRVRVHGVILDAFKDEIDPATHVFILRSGSDTITLATLGWDFKEEVLLPFIGSEVDVIGICLPLTGNRKFASPYVEITGPDDIAVQSQPLADISQIPPLELRASSPTDSPSTIARRRIVGRVLSTWQGKNMLVEMDTGQRIHVTLARGVPTPSSDTRLNIAGYPEVDNFSVRLGGCLYSSLGTSGNTPNAAESVSGRVLMTGKTGKYEINFRFRNRLVRIDGVISSVPSENDASCRIGLESDGFTIPVDVSSNPDLLSRITTGCRARITGYCILQPTPLSRHAPFQQITGLFVVPRSNADVVILSRPPWLTVRRLLIVIGSLLAVIVGIFIRNRRLNRIIERRSRELMREEIAHARADLKVEERTRLAVELHDTLSQNITGVALQIDAAQTAAEKDPASVLPYLEVTQRKMQNCRDNLRNCLWDLRSRAFEEENLGDAIRKTIAHHLGKSQADIDCDIPCRGLSDNTIHAVLCIIRELTVNAIRHGNAAKISISGKQTDERLSFVIRDDGCGFDPATRPGMPEGHFGLQGIDERIRRLDGTWRIDSKPGCGCTVTIENLLATS